MKDQYLKIPYGTMYLQIVGGTMYAVTPSLVKEGSDWLVIEQLRPLEFEEEPNE